MIRVTAREFYEEALTLVRQESVKILIPLFTHGLAMAACSRGDYRAALSLNLEALGISEESGYTIALPDVSELPPDLVSLWGSGANIWY